MKRSVIIASDDGDIPNNRLPLIVYEGAIDATAGDPAVAFEDSVPRQRLGRRLAERHLSRSTTIIRPPTRCSASPAARPRSASAARRAKRFRVKAGDAVLIPAGVGHKRLSSSHDLLVIGAYPGGQWADLMREGAEDKAGIRARIAAVAAAAGGPRRRPRRRGDEALEGLGGRTPPRPARHWPGSLQR